MGLEILSAFVDRLSTRFKSYVAMGKLILFTNYCSVWHTDFFMFFFLTELVLCKCTNVIVYNSEIHCLAF